MASASNDREKTPPEDDHQDPKLKEEVESEAEEEEMEEYQRDHMIEEGSKESFSLKRNYVNYRENYRQRSLK
jgi:hypothetical protein